MHHRKMPAGRASLHRRQHHAIDRLMPFHDGAAVPCASAARHRDSARFHMPGTRDSRFFNSFRDVFAIDYTETYGTGNLYLGDGPIRDAEVARGALFRRERLLFPHRRLDAGHPRHARRGGRPRRQRAHRPRGAPLGLPRLRPARHHAVFLLRAPARTVRHSGALRVEDAERQLLAHPDIRAVLLTSPTYYGLRRDLPAFADLCRAHGKLLLVDAAHGAHFPAVGLPSPVEEGAIWPCSPCTRPCRVIGQAAVLLSGPGTDRASLRENTACSAPPARPIPSWPRSILHAHIMRAPAAKIPKAAAVCREMREYICAHTAFHRAHRARFSCARPLPSDRLHRRHRHHRPRSGRCAVERARCRL